MSKKGGFSHEVQAIERPRFCKLLRGSRKTQGGLYIPDAAKEKPQKGKIESIGDDVKSVKVGDSILFDKYSGSKITMDGTEYLILKEEDILGVFVA